MHKPKCTDPRTVYVERAEVETCNITETLVQLHAWASTMRGDSRQARGTLRMAFHGYDSDPRELWEVPAIRRFVQALDDKFPYWFYFADLRCDFLKLILFCLVRVSTVRPGLTRIDPEDTKAFLLKHFYALNMLLDDWGMDSSVKTQITDEIMAYLESASINT